MAGVTDRTDGTNSTQSLANSCPVDPPDWNDAVGVAPGLWGYQAAAPTAPHLGWTLPQVNALTSGAGRPLADVLGAMDPYGVPQRGLNGIPNTLFSDSRIRIDQYTLPLQSIPDRFTPPASLINDPAAWLDAARNASAERNTVMNNVRGMISEQGLGTSQAAKSTAPAFESVWNGATQKMLQQNPAVFDGLTDAERTIKVAQNVVQKAGTSDPTFNALVQGADEASLGLKTLKYGGRALMVVGAVVDGASIVNEAQTSMQTGDWTNTGRQTAKVAGGWLGAAATGAAVGAAAGTIVPGLGNVAGFLVGAAAGALGYWAGSQLGEAAFDAAVPQG